MKGADVNQLSVLYIQMKALKKSSLMYRVRIGNIFRRRISRSFTNVMHLSGFPKCAVRVFDIA